MSGLSAPDEHELVDALVEAFTPEDLDYKVAVPLRIPTAGRGRARNVRERARSLVKWAITNGVDAFVMAALRGNPSNPRLRQFAESIGLLTSQEELLGSVRSSLKALNMTGWRRMLGLVQRQVCSINIKVSSASIETECTGFLVGDDQVMTIGSPIVMVPGSEITFVFEGTTLGIHKKDPIVVDADHVRVLRLERPIARELENSVAEVSVRTRGWIAPGHGSPPASDDRIIIVQYVNGSLRITIGTNDPSAEDANEVRYQTASYAGSLGAPCFDADWQIVGFHVGGDEGTSRRRTIEAIVRALAAAGYGWDSSRGIYRTVTANPIAAASHIGQHDVIVRGIAPLLETDDVWSDAVEDLGLEKRKCWSWVEAAAVHATYDPGNIFPFGESSPSAQVALLLESRQIGERWILNEHLRKAALMRLVARGSLQDARGCNKEDVNDLLDVMFGRLIRREPLRLDGLCDPDTLRALLTAIAWLDGIVAPLPDAKHFQATLGRATLLAPFYHLTKGFFAGREEELANLKEYCESNSTSPLFIHAPGGMGKSALLAHFVIQMAEHDPANPAGWQPFVFIDFDRPELDASNLAGVLVAIVQQLGAQVPEIAEAAQSFIQGQQQRRKDASTPARRGSSRKLGNIATQVATGQGTRLLDQIAPVLKQLPTGKPIVMILDTLEEVQFSNPDALVPLVSLVKQLQTIAPQLRPILAGRLLVEEEITSMELGGLRHSACVALLQNELPVELATNIQLVERLADLISVCDKNGKLRGNPLSLRLVAEVVRRESSAAERVIEELDEELQVHVSDAILHGRLYERILGHIHDKRVAALVHPGFALRVITWELIRDVLAVPCGLGKIEKATALKLFDELAKEIAVIKRRDDANHLELRPELRRIVREDLLRDRKLVHQRMQIHAAAVKYYAQRPLPSDRAEEIYHRLALGEDTAEVDKRWIVGIESYLRDALGELPPAANAYLANRVGGIADEKQLATASWLDWEEYAQKHAADLLKFGQPQRALDLLARRGKRLPGSKLHYVESIARRMLPVPQLSAAELAAEAAVEAARYTSNADDIRDALEELVHVRRLRNDTVGVLRGLAELAHLSDALGDDLVLLEANVQGLEATVVPRDRQKFTQSAVQVFSRLPDQLLAKAPELSRRVAAQIGGSEPAMLQRVLRVVGTGSLDRVAAIGLHKVLEGWQHIDPEVRAFIPDVTKSPREIAGAARYLATTREMDLHTAQRFAEWLGSVVSPNI